MYTEKNSICKWLIKSENKILGPYSYEQIEDLVLKKQISLIDEVRDTEIRWLYVRENPEFKNVVETIRKELETKQESTKTIQTSSKTEEFAKTKTQVPISAFENHPFEDIETENEENSSTASENSSENFSFSQIGSLLSRPNVKESQSNENSKSSARTEVLSLEKNNTPHKDKEEINYKREKVKLYGLKQDKAVQKNLKSTTFKFLVTIGFINLFLIVSYFGFNYYQKYLQTKQEEVWTQQIKKYKFLGLDQKAIEIYNRLPSDTQTKLLPQVIELLPLLEQNGIIQSSEIEILKKNNNLNLEQKANIQLVQFWQAVQSQNYDLAQDMIVKASAILPSSHLIKENDALIQLKKSQFQKSFDLFSNLNTSESSGRYLLGQVISFLGMSESEQSKSINQLSEQIEKYTLVFFDYKKELLLAQLYFAKTLKNDSLYHSTWKQFINTPCQLSSFFRKPLLLAPNTYLWKDLDSYINLIKPNLNSEEQVIFETHHLLESAQINSASQYVNANSQKIKNNAIRQQLNMLIYHFQSRRSDVLALIKTKMLDEKSELNQIILALNKLESDSNSDISEHLQYFQENHILFYHDWLSLIQLVKKKNLEPIKNFTRNHFLTVNNFIPALEAKSLVE